MATSALCSDINLISEFLAPSSVPSLSAAALMDCMIVCASQLLTQPAQLFSLLQAHPDLTKTLVLVGGIGHSTTLLYTAIAAHPIYHTLAPSITGLPEARVLGAILETFFDVKKITSQGCRILYEDRSTNCGANATETRKVLEQNGISAPGKCVVVQDPTMLKRTIASFEHTYSEMSTPPQFLGWPIFVPKVAMVNGQIEYAVEGVEAAELWEKQRFYDLIVGEVARLRDTEDGYGPRGKGFIGHVDVPEEVVLAAERVKRELGAGRGSRVPRIARELYKA